MHVLGEVQPNVLWHDPGILGRVDNQIIRLHIGVDAEVPWIELEPPHRSAPATDEPKQSFARTENGKMIDFLRGTDVLIMDTQYDAAEYKRHTGWGHGCLDDVVALAIEAEVKTLFLFHHDPSHDDAKISQMLAHARKIVSTRNAKLHVEAAREGVTVELPARVRA